LTRRRLILAGVVLLALAGSFGAGRVTGPPTRVLDRSETHATADTRISDKLSIATAEVLDLKRDLATWQARAASAEAHTVTVTRWRTLPGGGTEVSQEARTDTKSEEHVQGGTKDAVQAQRASDGTTKQEHEAEQHQTVVTLHTHEVTDARPTWSAGLLVGLHRGGSNLLDAVPLPLVIGGQVSRRILGPGRLGAWGLLGRSGEKLELAGGLGVGADW